MAKILTHSFHPVRYLSNGAGETKRFAKVFAKKITGRSSGFSSRLRRQAASIIGLTGDLGAGKTTFIQGFLKGLGVKKRITSPTFVLIKNYELRIKNYGINKRIYHIDCYRIQKPQELLKLGFREIINNPKNIVLIEWAEKIKKILPKRTNWIKFEYGKKENERKIILATKYENIRNYEN
jgi:tRNA threonylcarbamoyladenosine biosynthesis protein TsaE